MTGRLLPPDRGWLSENAPGDNPHLILYFVTAAAVLLGLWGRFKGLGDWPLSADEYYIARSVEDVIRTGLPAFDCGGYYTRGLLFQYILAPLQLAGLSAELSARLVAAVSSVIALPAVHLLGRRVHGPTVGLLAVCVIALSAWEVDIARFGRMYTPFQAVFAWYLVYFVRYTVDADARALRPMFLLTLAGILTWEGGVLMAFANLLPPFLRNPNGAFSARDFRYFGLCAALIALAAISLLVDFRYLGDEPFPSDFQATPITVNGQPGPDISSPLGIAFMLVALSLAAASMRWIWSLRHRWPTALGLAVALAASLAHQFSLVTFILAILLLARMLAWRELFTRKSLPFVATIAVCAVGWTLIGLFNPAWSASLEVPWGESHAMLALAYEFLRFPDFIGIVALAFARAAPILGAVLFAAIAIAVLREIQRGAATITVEQVLLVVLVSLLGVASLSDPPRVETRYVFFLFPVAVVIAIALAVRAVQRLAFRPLISTLVAIVVVAIGFNITGDLQPRRLIQIDVAPKEKSNILRRSDSRSAAQWLADHATTPGSLVINGLPGVDFYFKSFDFAYIGKDNQRYVAYACRRGTVERWGNLPLLSDTAGLNAQIARNEAAFIVIDTPSSQALIKALATWHPRVAWTSVDGYISILAIDSWPKTV